MSLFTLLPSVALVCQVASVTGVNRKTSVCTFLTAVRGMKAELAVGGLLRNRDSLVMALVAVHSRASVRVSLVVHSCS